MSGPPRRRRSILKSQPVEAEDAGDTVQAENYKSPTVGILRKRVSFSARNHVKEFSIPDVSTEDVIDSSTNDMDMTMLEGPSPKEGDMSMTMEVSIVETVLKGKNAAMERLSSNSPLSRELSAAMDMTGVSPIQPMRHHRPATNFSLNKKMMPAYEELDETKENHYPGSPVVDLSLAMNLTNFQAEQGNERQMCTADRSTFMDMTSVGLPLQRSKDMSYAMEMTRFTEKSFRNGSHLNFTLPKMERNASLCGSDGNDTGTVIPKDHPSEIAGNISAVSPMLESEKYQSSKDAGVTMDMTKLGETLPGDETQFDSSMSICASVTNTPEGKKPQPDLLRSVDYTAAMSMISSLGSPNYSHVEEPSVRMDMTSTTTRLPQQEKLRAVDEMSLMESTTYGSGTPDNFSYRMDLTTCNRSARSKTSHTSAVSMEMTSVGSPFANSIFTTSRSMMDMTKMQDSPITVDRNAILRTTTAEETHLNEALSCSNQGISMVSNCVRHEMTSERNDDNSPNESTFQIYGAYERSMVMSFCQDKPFSVPPKTFEKESTHHANSTFIVGETTEDKAERISQYFDFLEGEEQALNQSEANGPYPVIVEQLPLKTPEVSNLQVAPESPPSQKAAINLAHTEDFESVEAQFLAKSKAPPTRTFDDKGKTNKRTTTLVPIPIPLPTSSVFGRFGSAKTPKRRFPQDIFSLPARSNNAGPSDGETKLETQGPSHAHGAEKPSSSKQEKTALKSIKGQVQDSPVSRSAKAPKIRKKILEKPPKPPSCLINPSPSPHVLPPPTETRRLMHDLTMAASTPPPEHLPFTAGDVSASKILDPPSPCYQFQPPSLSSPVQPEVSFNIAVDGNETCNPFTSSIKSQLVPTPKPESVRNPARLPSPPPLETCNPFTSSIKSQLVPTPKPESVLNPARLPSPLALETCNPFTSSIKSQLVPTPKPESVRHPARLPSSPPLEVSPVKLGNQESSVENVKLHENDVADSGNCSLQMEMSAFVPVEASGPAVFPEHSHVDSAATDDQNDTRSRSRSITEGNADGSHLKMKTLVTILTEAPAVVRIPESSHVKSDDEELAVPDNYVPQQEVLDHENDSESVETFVAIRIDAHIPVSVPTVSNVICTARDDHEDISSNGRQNEEVLTLGDVSVFESSVCPPQSLNAVQEVRTRQKKKKKVNTKKEKEKSIALPSTVSTKLVKTVLPTSVVPTSEQQLPSQKTDVRKTTSRQSSSTLSRTVNQSTVNVSRRHDLPAPQSFLRGPLEPTIMEATGIQEIPDETVDMFEDEPSILSSSLASSSTSPKSLPDDIRGKINAIKSSSAFRKLGLLENLTQDLVDLQDDTFKCALRELAGFVEPDYIDGIEKYRGFRQVNEMHKKDKTDTSSYDTKRRYKETQKIT